MRKIISCLLSAIFLSTACQSQSAQQPVAESNFTKLVWSDEFDTPGLPDAARWAYEEGYIRNQEMQYYTRARAENARVADGHLIITARNDSAMIDGVLYPVTSASLATLGLADWTYGRIEVKAKLPSSLGTWPAIWMLGTNIAKVGWPECGEIDIMEHVGYSPDSVHTTVHTEAYNHIKGTQRGKAVYLPDASTSFHLYAVNWNADRIQFLMDDTIVFTFENNGKGWQSWPFDQPFYLILNQAFGGAWGGFQGTDLKSLPQQFVIDYVRVYQ